MDPLLLESGLKPEDVETRPYRKYVRECLDLLIEHGTDRYGTVRSPMLMNILDVRTRTSPENPLPLDEAVRVTRRGRRGPAGCNLYPDQPTVRAMFVLSRMEAPSGTVAPSPLTSLSPGARGARQPGASNGKYARFAEDSLRYTIEHMVDDQGLWWWGWHRHYDAYRDQKTGHSGDPHEIHIQEVIWPELWTVDPKAVAREIEGLWQWHVIDKTTGEVNRHADGQRGCDFAMSGGEILQAFAFLHSKTHDRRWLDRARLVADYYWKARDPKTGLIPNRPNAGRSRFDGAHFDTSITAFLCRGLLRAWEFTGESAFRQQAVAYLRAFARYGFDAKREQFWGSLKLDGTPMPGPRVVGDYQQYEPRGLIDLWQPYVAGYEHPLATAQIYAYAAHLTRDADREAHKELLAAAKRWAATIRAQWPPRRCQENTWYRQYATEWAPQGTYAEHYGRTISFFLHLHQLTGDAQHLRSARDAANEAVAKLYYKGLLRGHPCKPYYESMDGVGYLLCALLQLDQAAHGKPIGIAEMANW